MIRQKTYTRPGLTLLEVVLAMFIFMISIIAIWQLVTMGSDRAFDIRQETRTSNRCQAKLAEVIVGAIPLMSSGSYTPYEDDDKLQWKLEITESDAGVGLYNVKVTVKFDAGAVGARVSESQLCAIVMDPTMRGTSLDRALPPPTAPATDPSTTPSTTTP